MSRYLIVMNQDGGCDYTIGCGCAVTTFTADPEKLSDRIEEVIDDFNGFCDSESRVDSVEVYEVVGDIAFNINAVHQRRAAEAKAKKQAVIEKQERAEFERLGKKYNT